MPRIISSTKTIKVTDAHGDAYKLIFHIPAQSKLRAIRKSCMNKAGEYNGYTFSEKIEKESIELLMDVEGAVIGFDDNPENRFAVCSAMSQENIQKVKDYYDQNQLEYSDRASGWKAAFMTLFHDVFQSAVTRMWSSETEAEEAVGK